MIFSTFRESKWNCCLLFVLADGACTFPTALQGSWLHSEGHTVNVTSTQMSNYYQPGGTVINLPTYVTYECGVIDGSKYVLQTSFSYSAKVFKAMLCFTVQEQTDNIKIVYYEGSSLHQITAINERIATMEESSYNAATDAEIVTAACNGDPTTRQETYLILLNKGASITSVSINCPFTTQGSYSSTQCTTTTALGMEICYTPTSIMFDSAACSATQGFSNMANVYCVYSVSDGTYTYLTTYNYNDAIDSSTTYDFTCYAYSETTSTIQTTLNPKYCSQSQNDSTISTPGEAVTYTLKQTCPVTTTPNNDTTTATSDDTIGNGVIAGIVLGILFLLLIIIALIVICCLLARRKKRRKLKQEQEEEEEKKKKAEEERRRRGHGDGSDVESHDSGRGSLDSWNQGFMGLVEHSDDNTGSRRSRRKERKPKKPRRKKRRKKNKKHAKDAEGKAEYNKATSVSKLDDEEKEKSEYKEESDLSSDEDEQPRKWEECREEEEEDTDHFEYKYVNSDGDTDEEFVPGELPGYQFTRTDAEKEKDRQKAEQRRKMKILAWRRKWNINSNDILNLHTLRMKLKKLKGRAKEDKYRKQYEALKELEGILLSDGTIKNDEEIARAERTKDVGLEDFNGEQVAKQDNLKKQDELDEDNAPADESYFSDVGDEHKFPSQLPPTDTTLHDTTRRNQKARLITVAAKKDEKIGRAKVTIGKVKIYDPSASESHSVDEEAGKTGSSKRRPGHSGGKEKAQRQNEGKEYGNQLTDLDLSLEELDDETLRKILATRLFQKLHSQGTEEEQRKSKPGDTDTVDRQARSIYKHTRRVREHGLPLGPNVRFTGSDGGPALQTYSRYGVSTSRNTDPEFNRTMREGLKNDEDFLKRKRAGGLTFEDENSGNSVSGDSKRMEGHDDNEQGRKRAGTWSNPRITDHIVHGARVTLLNQGLRSRSAHEGRYKRNRRVDNRPRTTTGVSPPATSITPVNGGSASQGSFSTVSIDLSTASSGKRNLHSKRLQKLLEELYKDKKYLDYVTHTTEPSARVKKETVNLAQDGIDFLLDRACFWEDRGVLPPRPTPSVLRTPSVQGVQIKPNMYSDAEPVELSWKRCQSSVR